MSQLSVGRTEKMVSLDVESLFTNVPIIETVDIIVDTTYNIITPHYQNTRYRPLCLGICCWFAVCTTETPFQFRGETYVYR